MDNQTSKTVLVMAGGTGGHIYPALAVADELTERGNTIHWLGSKQGMEQKLVPKQGYNLHTIDVVGLRGKGIARWLAMPFILSMAVYQAWKVIKQVQPSVVIGMGGFASGPGGIAAWLSRVPLVLQEQNAIAGLTNRCLFPFAKYVLTGFPGSFEHSPKVKHTGNPVRKTISRVEKTSDANQPLKLLILGGSLGAQYLNKLIPEFVKQTDLSIEVKHQCGQRDHEMTQALYADTENIELISFIDDMAAAYAWADVVVCRSGALTVTEICLAGVAAIFVPFPYAVDDHQAENARYLSDNKAALFVRQENLTEKWLQETLEKLNANREQIQSMASKAFELAKPNATKEVSDLCMEAAYA